MAGPSVPRREAGGESLSREAVAGGPGDVWDIEVEAEVEERRHHLPAGIATRARAVRQTLHAPEQDVLSADLGRNVPGGIARLLDHQQVLRSIRAASPYGPARQVAAEELGSGGSGVGPFVDAAGIAKLGHVHDRFAHQALRPAARDLQRGGRRELALHLLGDGGTRTLDEGLRLRHVEAGIGRVDHARDAQGDDQEQEGDQEGLEEREPLLVQERCDPRATDHFFTSTVDRTTGSV